MEMYSEPHEKVGTEAEAAPESLDPTGVPNLDLLLGGGMPRGALVLLVGSPGSGKTTLASQMAFTAARGGRRVLILTALAEPANKLIAHLRSFTFYDESLVGDVVQVFSLAQHLAEGLSQAALQVMAMVRQTRADVVVLDGFRAVIDASGDSQGARAFLYKVGTALSMPGVTVIITAEATPRDPTIFPEVTTADVLLGLHYGLEGARHHRAIEVIKLRGTAPLGGLHCLAISTSGAVIYPRLEARVASLAEQAEEAAESDERAAFGLPELDALLSGGLTRQTSTLLLGSLGTGKTLLGLHFALACVAAGDATVFLGFRESRAQLLRLADIFALGPRLRAALAQGGGLALLRLDPVELDPDIVADELLAALDAHGARRLVVDSVAELERAAGTRDARRVDDYLAALLKALRARGVTALFVKENRTLLTEQLQFTADALAILAENVLVLQQVTYRDQLVRVLSVLKMRFSAHDVALREFRITPTGIMVLAPRETRAELLTGIARQQGAPIAASENVAESPPKTTP